DDKTISKRSTYFQQYGWVGNTMSMGKAGENEIIIDKKLFDKKSPIHLAAGLMPEVNPTQIISLPEGHSAGCANAKLVSGDPNESYNFLPTGWYRIDLE
ncbi:hypothetical protein, partial [Fulvivirga aurantia]|uniref:hypothetical protein n=1 Tax=Fulvivirga aurantia TaxID=2529383 RepID=UPI00162A9E54